MWNNVIGQQRPKEILMNMFSKKRIPHAMLFHGPEGTGKDAAAVEFAMLVNCDSPVDGVNACGACRNCRDISLLRPPLMRFVTALPAGRNESEDKALLTGYSGKKKVFMISQADRMNQQSSNALLKVLEEPPEDNLLILTSSRINSLLPTIIGRCQLLRFDPLSDEDVHAFIKREHPELDGEASRFYAALSQGSISSCREIVEQDFLELREKAISFLASSVTGRHLAAGKEIDSVIASKDKQKIKRFLSLLSVWFRDAALVASGNEANVINKDKLDRLRKFASNFSINNYAVIKLIEEAVQDIDRNIFPELLLNELSMKITGEMQAAG